MHLLSCFSVVFRDVSGQPAFRQRFMALNIDFMISFQSMLLFLCQGVCDIISLEMDDKVPFQLKRKDSVSLSRMHAVICQWLS